MTRKLTITISDEVYEGLYRRVGSGKISRFLERLVRPYVVDAELEAEYRAMAADEVRESAALEWADDFVSDVIEEPESLEPGGGDAPG